MKGYKKDEQAFGEGDIAILQSRQDPEIRHRVKIIMPIQDEDGSWWYEVEGIDLSPSVRLLTREVPQEWLEKE